MKWQSLSYLVIPLLLVLSGCGHISSDLPPGVAKAPETSIWQTTIFSSKAPYKIKSLTRLTGKNHSAERQDTAARHLTVIATALTGDWNLQVEAGTKVANSWTSWISQSKVKKMRKAPKWASPAVDWQHALSRLHAVSTYLLGQSALPLKATIILIPDGKNFENSVTLRSKSFVPMEFAFWYPVNQSQQSNPHSHGGLIERQFAALVHASSRLLYEFQHVELAAGAAKAPLGQPANILKDEGNSYCWILSAQLAMLVGTHSRFSVPNMRPQFASLKARWGQTPTYQTAIPWAKAMVTRDLKSYLNSQGFSASFIATNRKADNAVFRFCRAITLSPVNLEAGIGKLTADQYPDFLH